MSYWIYIFNQHPITDINAANIKAAITASNFETLCEQYHLDKGLIEPTLSNLDLVQAPNTQPLLFLLRYDLKGAPTIPVYQWDVDSRVGADRLNSALTRVDGMVRQKLVDTTHIIAVELHRSQLQDLGLLLGYELARWAGEQGEGLVYGLDGGWYRLNRHQAFIPLSSDLLNGLGY